MTKAIGLVAGAALLAAGGVLGWCARSPGDRSPRIGDAPVEGLAAELALLRDDVRQALERARDPVAVPVIDPAERASASAGSGGAAGVSEGELVQLLRRIDEHLAGEARSARGEERAIGGARTGAARPARSGDPGAGFERIEELVLLAQIRDERAEVERTTGPNVEFRDRVRAAYFFWTLDQVLARHGSPTEADVVNGELYLRYALTTADGAQHELVLGICEGRVVSAEFD